MEWLNAEWILKVIAVVGMVNAILFASSAGLEKIKIAFGSDKAGKAAQIIAKIAAGIQVVLDAVGYNPKHIEKK